MINKRQFLIGLYVSMFLFLIMLISASTVNSTMFPSGADEKCITGCVGNILNKTFIINNTEEVTGEAQGLVDMLKNMNFNLSAELDSCQAKLDNKKGMNPVIVWVTIGIVVLLLLWKTFLVFDKKKRIADLDNQ